eukprot:2755058-Alexandrium_andersonii.AAC.1
MSASLVGSEMCIRDRVGATLRRCSRCFRQVVRAFSTAQKRREPPQLFFCLLYTSDAADDM